MSIINLIIKKFKKGDNAMRKSKVLIVLMVLALFLIGCGSSSNNESSDGEVELSWYFPVAVGGALTDIIDGMAEDFHEENPDIKIKPIYSGTYDETMTKVQTAIQGKTTPDIAVLLSTELFTLKDMGAIIPLDDFIDESEKSVDFFPAFMENSQDEGQTWSLPFQRSTVVLYYNKDAFEAAGLDPDSPPETWEEVIEYSNKIKEADVTRYGVEIPSTGLQTAWLFQALALQNGDNLMNEDGTEVYFDTPENVEALEFWLSLAEEHEVMPSGTIDWSSSPTDFLEERTAMLYHTTGNLTDIKEKADFDFGVAYLPGNQSYGTPTGGGNLYIFDDIPDENKEAAYKFIEWLTLPEQAAEWSAGTGYIATSEAAYETSVMKEYVETLPGALVAKDQLEYASAELSTHKNSQVVKILNDNIQNALTGGTSAEEALKKAQEEAEQILN